MNYIISGNLTEAVDWLNENNKSRADWKYLSKPEQLRGLSEVHGVFIGTWKERPDIEDILDVMASMRKPGTLHSLGLATAILHYEAYKHNLEKNLV